MTAESLASLVRKNGTLRVVERSGAVLHVPVVILDAREVWGRIDVLISPQTQYGEAGEAWVSSERVKVRAS